MTPLQEDVVDEKLEKKWKGYAKNLKDGEQIPLLKLKGRKKTVEEPEEESKPEETPKKGRGTSNNAKQLGFLPRGSYSTKKTSPYLQDVTKETETSNEKTGESNGDETTKTNNGSNGNSNGGKPRSRNNKTSEVTPASLEKNGEGNSSKGDDNKGEIPANNSETTPVNTDEVTPAKIAKKRGRPKKDEVTPAKIVKKRGRPKKNTSEALGDFVSLLLDTNISEDSFVEILEKVSYGLKSREQVVQRKNDEAEKLVNAIREYKRKHKSHKKDELYLADMLK